MKELTPEEYAAAFQRGENIGFEYFFNTLYKQLVYYAFKITNDKISAEDAVSESFIKVWDKREEFIQNHPKVIKAYLYTCVRRCCLIQLAQFAKKSSLGVCSNMIDETEPVDQNIIRAELIGEMIKDVEALPQACRQIMKLIYFEGLTVKEIADKLALSISCIKNQKVRGLELLRKKRNISTKKIRQVFYERLNMAINSDLGNTNSGRIYGFCAETILRHRKLKT